MIRSLPLFFAFYAASASGANLPQKCWKQTRKLLNFGSTFGSATKALPYDRIAGHPVFSVTTAWGSAYMSMEKKAQLEEIVQEPGVKSKKKKAIGDDQAAKYRTVCLYFMDPDDAIAMHGEMKQIDSLKKSDIRITSFSLSKALRQSANLLHGLPTGHPLDESTGNVPVEDGGALRYKIVPAKRQLFYAARCHGRERVGLLSDTPEQDASLALSGSVALQGANLRRRSKKRDKGIVGVSARGQQKSDLQLQNAHMDGYTGVPVFHSPHIRKRLPLLKQLLSGNRFETPLFFNYEDMEATWKSMKKEEDAELNPEVFNMWDVLTSMDKRGVGRPAKLSENPIESLKRRLIPPKTPGLEHITFVPSSRAVEYKDSISVQGNSKARLPRQRQWMQHSPS